ncbi:MAG TPA: GNAT family N-acetyltransferase [Actinophytocola sp.]|uniref:GNAT family N-acetyltransferase n=1 Tax=Actinophytocola sp. TaxID=1872138 RepID=UPI002F9232BB
MTQTLAPARDTSFDVRVLSDGELRTASTVFREALHEPPHDDEKWAVWAKVYEPGRSYGAFAGDTMIGTVTSLASSMTVPGGATVPMAAVTGVGVRADHRRRGALTAMIRRELEDLAAAGETLAALHASEPAIYGRFGYGLGTLGRSVKLRSGRARLRDDVPTAGTVRLLSTDEALTLLPAAYPPLQATRPGMMSRGQSWWVLGYERRFAHEYFRVAAHHGADGTIDGWVGYKPGPYHSGDPRDGSRLYVLDFHAANQGVANDLWRYLIGIDLVEELIAYGRPMDDPIEAMLTDLFALRSDPDDELWVRVVDVPRALAARTYGPADPVVIEIVDPLLPGNSGRYLISPQGTERTSSPPGLTMTVEALGMIYLGTWRPSTLAAIGRLTAKNPVAAEAADRLFATDRPSWCGSLF